MSENQAVSMRFNQLVSEEAWKNARTQKKTLIWLKEQKKIYEEKWKLWDEQKEERMKRYEREYQEKIGSIKIKNNNRSIIFLDQKTESGDKESFIIHQDNLFNLYKIKLVSSK